MSFDLLSYQIGKSRGSGPSGSYIIETLDSQRNLQKIEINMDVVRVRLCSDCTLLTEVVFNNKVKHILDYAFSDCHKLVLTTLPPQLTELGLGAFQSCRKLTSITFQSVPTKIEYNVFSYCTNLTQINVPWSYGEVSGAPWGATNATINYDYEPEE